MTENTRQKIEEDELFKKDPRVNVISKETYEERTRKVFKLLWETLSKSFGPYGAPTLIYNYPYSHVTKDGFTIMKNLSMDASEQLVDQSIANMASDICGRLNFAVGDGTTSAVIATNSIYQNYLKKKNELENKLIMPRDIMQAFNDVKYEIINELHKKVVSIQSDDPEVLYNNIYNVVYISSNGDKEMSENIASLYSQLRFPGISCEMSADGISRSRLIEGYSYDLVLNDKTYINSDDGTMKISGADVIIFSVKITKAIYERILVPLNECSRLRGRKLIVCASTYDQTALGQTIRRDLTNEFQKTKDINMVLCSYSSVSDHKRKLIEDFSMLTNTIIIDRELRSYIEQQLDDGKNIHQIFNIDNRTDIPNLVCYGVYNNSACKFTNNDRPEGVEPIAEMVESPITLGYVGKSSIGLKKSLFENFYYDENRYNVVVRDAKMTLDESIDKYKKLGTFNIVVNQAQQRYYALKLKMGIIEVGADSDLSQKLMKDAVDDAIRAAASAFDNGIVRGCNIDLIQSIINVKHMVEKSDFEDNKKIKSLYLTVLDILYSGFMDVYRTVLSNAFPDVDITDKSVDDVINILRDMFGCDTFVNIRNDWDNITSKLLETNETYGLHDLIMAISVSSEKVFDVSKKVFTDKVVNSTRTDEEILIATIDLIAILIAGNQMLITQKHNF